MSLFSDDQLFVPPLSNYEQGCLYSYVPLPFSSGFRLESQPGGTEQNGWPRLFYQFNYCRLPDGHPGFRPIPDAFSDDDRTAFEHVRQTWEAGTFDAVLPDPDLTTTSHVEVVAGESATIASMEGPGIIRRLEVRPEWGDRSATEVNRALRDLVLVMNWDGAESPSVEVPLGDFFGSFWRPRAFNSMFIGMTNGVFFSRFAMPFASSAKIRIRNSGPTKFGVSAICEQSFLPAWENRFGYFHACWRKTGPQDQGRPHTVLQASGSGKYVGCILSVASDEQNWWILEGDEILHKTEERVPGWRGTGLEDYFNGGWYYRNVMARPLNGLLQLSPFRTIQYRFHLPDPVLFQQGLNVTFERGPDHASKGWFESVGYFYLSEPSPVFSDLRTVADRYQPPDSMDEATFMLQVLDLERLGDFSGARSRVREFMERYPDTDARHVLALRLIGYDEKVHGIEAVRDRYAAVANATEHSSAQRQAQLLLWMHEEPNRALLGAYCNAQTRVYLDGKPIVQADHPKHLFVLPLTISPGHHTMVLESRWTRLSPWVQVYLRTVTSDIFSSVDGNWRWTKSPTGNIHDPDYNDSAWEPVRRSGKGPPQDPLFEATPNAFVGMQSIAAGMPLRVGDEKATPIFFRRVFTLGSPEDE
jgi:hypothetical protein